MKARTFLRVAAVLVAIQAVLHTIGGVFGKPVPGTAATVYATMKANHFMAMGVDRSYWMYFIGFGLCMAVSMVVDATIFWLLGRMAVSSGTRLRPIVVVFTAGYAAQTILSGLFFFPIPTIWGAVVVACLLGATLALKPVRADATVTA